MKRLALFIVLCALAVFLLWAGIARYIKSTEYDVKMETATTDQEKARLQDDGNWARIVAVVLIFFGTSSMCSAIYFPVVWMLSWCLQRVEESERVRRLEEYARRQELRMNAVIEEVPVEEQDESAL